MCLGPKHVPNNMVTAVRDKFWVFRYHEYYNLLTMLSRTYRLEQSFVPEVSHPRKQTRVGIIVVARILDSVAPARR